MQNIKKRKVEVVDNPTDVTFNTLIDDLKLTIFNYLTPQEQIKYLLVCSDWKRLLNNDRLWKNNLRCIGFFSNPSVSAEPTSTISLKHSYFILANAIQKFLAILTTSVVIQDPDDYPSYVNEIALKIKALLESKPIKLVDLL